MIAVKAKYASFYFYFVPAPGVELQTGKRKIYDLSEPSIFYGVEILFSLDPSVINSEVYKVLQRYFNQTKLF